MGILSAVSGIDEFHLQKVRLRVDNEVKNNASRGNSTAYWQQLPDPEVWRDSAAGKIDLGKKKHPLEKMLSISQDLNFGES